ncbi:hypothetical protein STCU_10745 [Strigomonas culicis]|uniref:Uncharacterized protein n=1 Tax=Strigomonas culicis TaxID=28005 RepID=S9TLJ1_9TRYP|nr:hypothetical protein STCU_10745 [Strigomonas culicis]|eukprot:EPY17228.1 hypothetical protein STCU_10745 [Strigomonas culicis]
MYSTPPHFIEVSKSANTTPSHSLRTLEKPFTLPRVQCWSVTEAKETHHVLPSLKNNYANTGPHKPQHRPDEKTPFYRGPGHTM